MPHSAAFDLTLDHCSEYLGTVQCKGGGWVGVGVGVGLGEWVGRVLSDSLTVLAGIRYHLTLVLLNPDIPCLCKQCRSGIVGF